MQTVKYVKDDNEKKKMGKRARNYLWWVRKVKEALFEKAEFKLRLEEKELVIQVKNKKTNTPDRREELEQASEVGRNLVCFNPP